MPDVCGPYLTVHAIGSVLGYCGIRILLAFNAGSLSMVGENGAAVTIDWRVTSFALVISLLTGVAAKRRTPPQQFAGDCCTD